MLADRVAKALSLTLNLPRRLCVSISGGVDSTVLLHILSDLRVIWGFELTALHLNYGLRGQESDEDEALCRRLCKELEIPLKVQRYRLSGGTAIQERARSLRIQASQDFAEDVEMVEAHHADDQVETFLMRLFRGSNVQGLSAMRVLTIRENRKVWRPFLDTPKGEIIAYAKAERIFYREDRSNRESFYDRNFLRNQILPQLDGRFGSFRQSILRTIATMQEESDRRQLVFDETFDQSLLSHSPYRFSGDRWMELRNAERCDFLHRLLKRLFDVTLSQEQTSELDALIVLNERFTYNAPKGVIVRGWQRQGRLEIEFCRAESPFQPLGVTNERLALY